jgi:hypothetical protein
LAASAAYSAIGYTSLSRFVVEYIVYYPSHAER